jgi:hypothetical protein
MIPRQLWIVDYAISSPINGLGSGTAGVRCRVESDPTALCGGFTVLAWILAACAPTQPVSEIIAIMEQALRRPLESLTSVMSSPWVFNPQLLTHLRQKIVTQTGR